LKNTSIDTRKELRRDNRNKQDSAWMRDQLCFVEMTAMWGTDKANPAYGEMDCRQLVMIMTTIL
jgi:hypothetical protein